jgi:CDP-diacylglycerol--glycerol-3-phosphate 3-phosphatidyltransferase
MSMVVASAHIDDEEFLRAFHRCELPASCFRHGDHLRLAWLQVHRAPLADALESVRSGIKRFAAHHGASHIYHETVTSAWVRLIATHRETEFRQFMSENQHRLNGALLHRFWTPEALNSEAARKGWLAPDREALPAPVCLY